MKKFILGILILTFSLLNFSLGWIGLIAQNWDILNVTKWNEMINVLNTKLDNILSLGTWVSLINSISWTTANLKSLIWWKNIAVIDNNDSITISLTWSVESSPIPYITSDKITIPINSTVDISISGVNFLPNSTLIIPGFWWTINSVTPISPFQLNANITTPSTTWIFDIVISNNGVLNTLWPWNWQGLLNIIDPNAIDINIIYEIALNASTRDDAKNQILWLGLLLAAIPTTNNVAENLISRNLPWDQLSDWEISIQYRTTTVQEFYIVYYLNDNFQFVARIWKNDWTTTTLDEFTDITATLYNYEIKYNNVIYTWTCNFNFASSSARNWTDGSNFSPDDGWWWFANWDIDFDSPWPYLYSVTDSWWFGNMNSSDWLNSDDLYINWTANNWTVVAYVFIKQP